MSKRFVKTVALTTVICLLCAFLLTGCGNSSKALVGRWVKNDDSGYSYFTYLEFFSDGTYDSDHPNYSGNYSIDGNRIRLSGILVETKTCDFQVKGKTLTLDMATFEKID